MNIAVAAQASCAAIKGVFKGGGFNPPPEIFRFFLKSEGKEIEKKEMLGGGGVTS